MNYLPALELVDRLCIARVKHGRTQGANQAELDWYENQFALLSGTVHDQELLAHNVASLTAIHQDIWDLEWQLKSGVEQQLSLEEIGRRAIRIRDHNNRRIAFKNSLATLLAQDPVREIKVDHLSADQT